MHTLVKKRIIFGMTVVLCFLFLGLFHKTSKAIIIPDRPPTFNELMILADKNLAANALIHAYIYNEKEGVGFQKVMTRAQLGDTKAELMACYLLTSGIGVEKNEVRGYALCKKAADKGSARARANLIYRDFNYDPANMNWQQTYNSFNDLMSIDPGIAHRGMQFLYRQNHPKASMPQMYHHLEKAIKYNNTNAMHSLSEFDLRIKPKKYRNYIRAEKNLKKAYSLYDFDAGFQLALEYRDGKKLVKNLPEYESMIKRMAGFLHSESMGELAYMYATGKGVAQDEATANALYIRAAKLGDVHSQKQIARHLLFGPIESRDYEAGIGYLEDQAKAGSIGAISILSDHYARAEIDDPENKSIKWRVKAALLGDEMSQETLGFGMMETGYLEAMQPYIDALEVAQKQGHPDASYLLARHYRAASGVKRDLKKARQILDKVAHLDDPRIREEIDIINGYIAHFGGIEAVPDIIEL